MKTLKKNKTPNLNIFNTRKTNKMNRFSERQIADAIIESISEGDFEKNQLGEVDNSWYYQTENYNAKNDLIVEKMISDLLTPSNEPLKGTGQTILFYDNRGKLESILTMETYNEMLLSGLENNNVNFQDTTWFCSLMEQMSIFNNNPKAYCSVKNEVEEYCHYVDVTNEA